jgi:hypothetical protein
MIDRAVAVSKPVSDRTDPLRPAESAPIVILTFSHSGVELLGDFLASSSSLSCTIRTGLLPMCESVASTWQYIEGREQLSALARSSIRALVTSMALARSVAAGARIADSGTPRWCETTISGTSSAGTFLKIFPQAKFVCFHRRCDEVISEVIESNPSGKRSSGRTHLPIREIAWPRPAPTGRNAREPSLTFSSRNPSRA